MIPFSKYKKSVLVSILLPNYGVFSGILSRTECLLYGLVIIKETSKLLLLGRGRGEVRGVEKGSRDAFQFWNAMTRETGQHKR